VAFAWTLRRSFAIMAIREARVLGPTATTQRDRTAMMLTLKSDNDLRASRTLLRQRGLDFSDPKRLGLWRLPYKIRFRVDLPNADVLKSWDVANALRLIEANVPDHDAPILDMGCFNSEILYALHNLGYRDVHGCDLNPLCRWMPYWHKIDYRAADLTKTPYSDGQFAAITCMSVVEHGVPLEPFVDEVKRLLRPGGLFVFTTDYDASGTPHEIDPQLRLFGQTWTIFTPETLRALVDRFLARGFTYLDPGSLDGTHPESPVHWNDQDYTFVMVALRAPG
jgi:SAM-dependent methyltransferase